MPLKYHVILIPSGKKIVIYLVYIINQTIFAPVIDLKK